ncbi:MAG: hypothetical protein ACUZ77_05550 [Candidatus Brocadiales bacterium]
MATENRLLDISFEAAEDLSNDQYRIVTLSGNKVQRPNAGTDIPLGVLQNAPASGEAAVVRLLGITKLQLGGTVAALDWIVLEYVSAADAGKGIKVATMHDKAIGLCVVGGAEDELSEVLLSGTASQVNVIPVSTQAAALAVQGTVIYNSATNKLNFHTGSAWEVVTSA